MSPVFLQSILYLLDDVGHDAPHLEVTVLLHPQFGELSVGGSEKYAIVTHTQTLDREVTVNEANGDTAVMRVNRTVNDEQVTLVDTRVHHRIADDTRAEGGCRIGDEGAVQVDAVGILSLGRAGKTSLNATLKELQARRFLISLEFGYLDFVHDLYFHNLAIVGQFNMRGQEFGRIGMEADAVTHVDEQCSFRLDAVDDAERFGQAHV